MTNYATKSDLKRIAGINISNFNLSDDKLAIDGLKTVLNALNNFFFFLNNIYFIFQFSKIQYQLQKKKKKKK